MAENDPALLALLPPELLARVETEGLRVSPGQNPAKPYVTTAQGKVTKGSGRPPGANDIAQISRETAHQRTRGYSDALQMLIPAEGDSGGAAVIQFKELIEQLRRLVVPKPIKRRKECPECKHEVVFEVDKAPDVKALIFAIERLAGVAPKTLEVHTRSEELIAILRDDRLMGTVEFVALTPEERARRARAMMMLNTPGGPRPDDVDGEYREVE